MTANELRNHISDKYGLSEWPKTLEVDAETYGNCCQAIFDWLKKHTSPIEVFNNGVRIHDISLGENQGLMFKGVELILKEEK